MIKMGGNWIEIYSDLYLLSLFFIKSIDVWLVEGKKYINIYYLNIKNLLKNFQ